jgi:hypothetical protein
LILHAGITVLALSGSVVCFWQAVERPRTSTVILVLLMALVLLVIAGIAAYRGYALQQGGYILERDGLRLRWGLRSEDIPLQDIEWIRPIAELGYRVPLPLWNVPGAVLGSVMVPELGRLEFIASDLETTLVVATRSKLFAISPQDPARFMQVFSRTKEMGSLSPMAAYSSLPAGYMQQVWSDPVARIPLLANFGLTLALLVVVSLLIPRREFFLMQAYLPPGVEPTPQPPQRLLLLPILGILTLAVDVVFGLFFYRRSDQRVVAYLLWVSGMLTPLLLLAAAFYLLGIS